MCFINHWGDLVAEDMPSACAEEYFCSPRRKKRPFRPPSLEEFVLELISELGLAQTLRPPEARSERARQAATRAEKAFDAGRPRPRAKFRPDPLEWPRMS